MKKKWMLLGMCLLMAVLLCLPVSAQTPAQYDPQTEGILSEYYTVDPATGYISGIVPGTSVQKLLSVCAPAGITCDRESLSTGTVLRYGESVSAIAVVTADLNGDGAVTISDMLMLKTAVLGKELTPLAAAAGDVNYDGKVTVTDFLKVKSVLLGQQQITQRPGVREKLLMLQPGETLSWEHGAAAWKSDNEAVVTVDEGMLTAVAPGAAFVYAMDHEGNLLYRQLITVCAEPLSVTLAEKSCRICKGNSQGLTALLNHPVTATVRWSSSDPQVATVENGTVTGLSYGTATVTAALDNGSKAQITVQVVPALDSISFDCALYKVKPGNTKKPVLTLQPADATDTLIFTSSDPSIATVAADGTVTGQKNGTVTLTVTGKYSGIQASCQVKVCNVKQVAFTFDDGPSQYTAQLLDFCKANNIKVTFFLVGDRMNYFASTIRRQAQEGHEIGYHSYSHDNQTKLTAAKIHSDYEYANRRLKELTGQGFSLWRAPGGNINDKVLSNVPLPHIMWSWDSRDWVSRNAEAVYLSVRNARDGDIVLMHDLYSFTVNGAIRAMQEMLAGDYEFLTVSELLTRNGKTVENGVNYHKG